jgi:hypothetical protein
MRQPHSLLESLSWTTIQFNDAWPKLKSVSEWRNISSTEHSNTRMKNLLGNGGRLPTNFESPHNESDSMPTTYINFHAGITPNTVQNLTTAIAQKVVAGTTDFYILLSTPGGQVQSEMTSTIFCIPAQVTVHNTGNVDSMAQRNVRPKCLETHW